MPQSFLDKLADLLNHAAGGALRYVAIAAVVIVLLWIVWRLFGRRRWRRFRCRPI